MTEQAMTESEKRIREMAEIIEKRRLEANITAGSLNEGVGMWYARDLYKEGYRKQSDTAKEILQYLYEKMGNVLVSDTELVKYLAARYGVEVKE